MTSQVQVGLFPHFEYVSKSFLFGRHREKHGETADQGIQLIGLGERPLSPSLKIMRSNHIHLICQVCKLLLWMACSLWFHFPLGRIRKWPSSQAAPVSTVTAP